MVVIISGLLLTVHGISRAAFPVGRCWWPGWTRTEAEESRLMNMYTYNKLWGQSAQHESSCPFGDNGDTLTVSVHQCNYVYFTTAPAKSRRAC